jgi:MFS family permease
VTDSEQRAAAGNAWRPLAVTLAIQALVAMALITVPVMGPVLAQALGISAAWLGIYVGVVYAAAMCASLAAGAAVARFGAIRVSQAGLLLCAAGLACSALGTAPAIAIGAVLVGLGYGPVTPASSHLLAQTTPAHRMSLVFSIKQTGVPLGGVLAGALVPGLLVLGWRGALLAVAAANVACALIAQPLRAPLDADRRPDRPLVLGSLAQPIRIVLANPALRLLAGCSFLFSIAQLSLTTYLVTYLHDALGYGLVAAGLALSVAQTAGVVGRVLWGWVADRWMGARRMLAALAGLVSVSAVLTAGLHAGVPTFAVLVLLSLFGASAIGWNGVYLAEVAREAPAGQASLATGGTLAFTFLGVVMGPPVFGALTAASGSYRSGFLGVAVALVLCLALLLRPLRRAAPVSDSP